MTMTSAAYDAIIAEILGGYEKPEVSEEKPKGLGAMTSRAGMKMPEVSDETEVPSSQAAVNKFMTAIASQRGSKAPAFVEKAYDPLTFTSEHMQRAGMKVMDALAMALEDPQEGKIKVPVGEDFKEDYFTNAENILNQMKSAAQGSSLDIRAANLTRGMTSKQTDTQPTVSADSSRDRLELQGEIRDLPVLDDEGAPEVDTRSNELLDKPLSTVREEAISNQGLMTKKTKGILDFIGEGEGGYNSANRGTKKVNNKNITIGSDLDASRNGKPISELTISEIQELQKIKDPDNVNRLFTVGKYQTTPDTLSMAVKALDLEGDVVFSPEIQDQIGMYLVGTKRKKLGQYLSGDENVSTDRAMLDLAMEFASIPVPYAIKKGTYGSWPKVDVAKGETFYKDGETNKALHTVEETRDMLTRSFGMIPDPLASIRPKARPDTRIASN